MKKLNEKGYTLFEVLIFAALAGVIGIVLSIVMVNSNQLFITQSNKINQGVGINSALSDINEAIRNAAFIATGYPVASPTYTTSASTLVLAIPSIDASGNIISSTYDYYVVTKDSANPKILRLLMFKDPSSSRSNNNKVLLTDLKVVQFTYLDKDSNSVSPNSAVKVNIVLNSQVDSGILSKQTSGSAQTRLRNL